MNVVRSPLPLIKGIALLSFLADYAMRSGYRLITEVESMSSKNSSMVEHDSGEASKIRTLAMT